MRMKRLICFIFTTLLLVSTTAFGEPTASDTTIARAKKLAQAITEISMAYHGRFVDSAVANLLDTNPAARPKWPTTNTIRAILPKDAGGAELLSISETGLGVNRENDGWLLVVPNQKYANPNEARIASQLLPLATYNEGTNTIRVPLIRPAAASTLGYIMEYVKVILAKRDGLGLDGTTATPTFHAGSSMILGNNSVLDVREADGIQFALTNAEIEGVGIIGRNANSRIDFQTGEVRINGDLRMTGQIHGQNLQLSGNLTKTAGTLSVRDVTINGNVALPAATTVTAENVDIQNEIRSTAGNFSVQGQLQVTGITASSNARLDARPSVDGRAGAASGTAWNKWAANANQAVTADYIEGGSFAEFVSQIKNDLDSCQYQRTTTMGTETYDKCVSYADGPALRLKYFNFSTTCDSSATFSGYSYCYETTCALSECTQTRAQLYDFDLGELVWADRAVGRYYCQSKSPYCCLYTEQATRDVLVTTYPKIKGPAKCPTTGSVSFLDNPSKCTRNGDIYTCYSNKIP